MKQISLMHKSASSSVDWEAIRNDFPILRERANGHPLIYFDNAATSQKPKQVLDALRNYYEHDNANVHRGLHVLSSRATEAYEKARQCVATYIGAASPDNIVFTRGTTESINLVAQAWGGKFVRAGDVILLTEMEHHSNLVPWQLLAERTGAKLRFVPVREDGTLALDQLSSLLTPEVKLFGFTHISNSLGRTTESINLVAQAWGEKFVRAGDVILLTEMEHHSNLVPWQLLAERTGAKLRFVPVREDGTLALDQLSSLLTPEVKLFGFTHISNSLGTINPVAELCSKAREVGAVTLVDAAQSVGHLPLNVQEIGCDFLAFSGHKMCAPTGIGALYGRAEILDAMPPWHGGGEMIVSVSFEKSSFKKPPHRFEAGTPNIAGAIGLAAAINYLEQIGRSAIFEHDVDLTRYAMKRMAELPGIRILGPDKERGALVGFVMAAAHPHDLTTFADQHGLAMRGGHHCNQPLMRRFGLPGTTRASFYFYNTTEEIDRMIDILNAAVRFFS